MLPWFARPSSARGFTQIEMTITVVVVGALAAIAIPSFSAGIQRQRLNVAFNQIELAIQQTQSEAVKRGQSCQFVLPPPGPAPSFSGSCLLSGSFTLEGVELNHSHRPQPWTITFNANGENPPDSAGTFWLNTIDMDEMQSKCLVISAGIGLRRVGQKTQDNCLTP